MQTGFLATPVLLAALLLAGCGGASGEAPAPAPPVTTAVAPAAAASVPAGPARIVSLSATATEMLFAIGAGSRVVAVDDQSDHPPEAPRTALSGLSPNAEAIADYRPDLVVIENDPGGLVDQLAALGIAVVTLPPPSTPDEAYTQVRELGAATGETAAADRVAATMQADVEAAIATAPRPAAPVRVYYELDTEYFSATSETFIGRILAALGLANVADEADTGSSGYPQLSAEHIVAADPQLILLADAVCCGQSAATVAARPGWDGIAAVAGGHVVALDDDLASRWGPRLPELVRFIARAIPS